MKRLMEKEEREGEGGKMGKMEGEREEGEGWEGKRRGRSKRERLFVLEKTALQQTTYTSLGITFIYINSLIYLSHLGITE